MYRLIKLLLLFVCLATGVSFGQVGSISGQVVNQNGTPVPFALVRVCPATATGTPCTPTAPIYLDYGLQTPAGNDFTSDQYGNYTVFVPALPSPNLYTIQFSPNNGITWQYVKDGPVNGAPAIQACNQQGNTAAAQINAAGLALPATGGVIDATCYGSALQTIDQQITAMSTATKPVELLLNPSTPFNITATFNQTLINNSIASGVSGAGGACVVPIGTGSSIITPGWNQPQAPPGSKIAYWRLQPGAATYDVFCNAAQDGTQESFLINGLGIIGDPGATMAGALLHMRLLYVSTIVENVTTYLPYGNALVDDGGSDQLFINDNINDSAHTGGYVGAVLTLNCPGQMTWIGGAVQFNGINNPLIIGRGYVPGLSQCPLGNSLVGTHFYNTDIELQAATVGTFPNAATNVDPIQVTDPADFIIDNMNVYGTIGAGQQHLVDILSSGENGQFRGTVEINNIAYQSYATWQSNGGGSLIHNGFSNVSPALADVFGQQNGSVISVGKYRWNGSGVTQKSSIDYEDVKSFTNVTSGTVNGDINASQQVGSDIGAKVNSALAACNGIGACTVRVPAGNYPFTTPILIPMNVFTRYALVLDPGATLQWNGNGCAITSTINTGSPTVVNLRINGGGQLVGGSGTTQCGIHVEASNGVWISGLLISGFATGDDIWIDGANAVWITNNLIQGGLNGVHATNTLCNGNQCSPTQPGGSAYTPNAVHISDNEITGNLQWGVYFQDMFTNGATGALNNSVENNDLEENGTAGPTYGAINVGRSKGFVVRGNYFEGSPRQLVLGFPGSPGAFFSSVSPIIRDNYFTLTNGTPYEIELQDTQDALIEGNSTLGASIQDTGACFINETETTGTYYGKNEVVLTTSGSTGSVSLFCLNGTAELQMSDPTSFTFFNPGFQSYLAFQNFQITTTATTDTIPLQYINAIGSCQLSIPPGNTTAISNARASLLAGTSYLSAIANGSVTLTHPTGNSMLFDILCENRPVGGYGP